MKTALVRVKDIYTNSIVSSRSLCSKQRSQAIRVERTDFPKTCPWIESEKKRSGAAKKEGSSRKCSVVLLTLRVSFDFPLRLPYRYSSTGSELVAIEPAVHHDTAERRDERGGIVLTGDLQDDLQIADNDVDDDDGDSGGDVHL